MHHSLSDQSTCAATVLGAWCTLPGAIPREEILTIFRDKGKRPKGNNSSELVSSTALPDVVEEVEVMQTD